jgi:hypothetical protein
MKENAQIIYQAEDKLSVARQEFYNKTEMDLHRETERYGLD